MAENNLAFPATYKEDIAVLQNLREEMDIKIVRCLSGHSLFLTRTEGLVAEVLRFGNKLVWR